jgi:lactoylglutathione lyase
MALRFRLNIWFVPDVAASVAFYEKAFGCTLRFMPPGAPFAELDTGATLLCFLSEATIQKTGLFSNLPYTPNRPGGTMPGAQIAFVSDDIQADWRRAVAAGASVVKPLETRPNGQTMGYLRDCNGLLVELTTPNARDVAEQPLP